MGTIEFCGRSYPIIGYVDDPRTEEPVPLVDIHLMSDYKWQLQALQSRLDDPEMYRTGLGEDVEAVIAQLRKWLEEHRGKGAGVA